MTGILSGRFIGVGRRLEEKYCEKMLWWQAVASIPTRTLRCVERMVRLPDAQQLPQDDPTQLPFFTVVP
jgi:hypothetical protein